MMEYWLQLVNDQSLKLITEQEAEKTLQRQRDDDQDTAFISVFSHKGNPILPPLMTPQRRREMQNHRSTALAIDGYLRGKNGCKSKARSLRASQQLQRSGILIYDNGLNKITNTPPPPSPPLSIPSSVLIEDPPLMAGQRAAVQLCAPIFAKASKSLVARSEPPAKPLIVGPRRPMSKLKEQELEEARKDKERREREKLQNLRLEHRHTMDLIEMAKALPWGFFQIEPLLRSNTDPSIHRTSHCRTESHLPRMSHSRTDSNLLRKDSNTESSLQLHPQLWKRKDTIVQSCPNSPRKYRYPIKKKLENETQEKPREGPKRYPKEEPKRAERKQSLERKPKPKGRFSLSPRRPAPPHNVSRGGYAFDPSLNSVAQRRRSYDPKASLMRDAKEKVVGKQMPHSTRQSAPFGRSPAPANTPKKTLSTVTIAQKEAEEKRQVFLELVFQQAEEQQRLQAQFEAQQQILIEQMLTEVNQLSNDARESTAD